MIKSAWRRLQLRGSATPAILSLRRGLRRRPAAVVGIVVVCGITSLFLIGIHQSFPAGNASLHAGVVWVVSNEVGELTLLDGTSAEAAGSISVAPAGDSLTVVQVGHDGYVLNRTTAGITRVDGATRRTVGPNDLLHGDSTQVMVNGNTAYVVDSATGRMVAADPQTLTPLGAPVGVAQGAQPVVTGNGRLWFVEPRTGQLRRYNRTTLDTQRRALATGETTLITADGNPVLVDTLTGNAQLLDPASGDAQHSMQLDYTPPDLITGSNTTPEVMIVRPIEDALSVCRFDEPSCRQPMYLRTGAGSGKTEFGPALSVGNHVLVPDYATSTVWVVDLERMKVVASPRLFAKPAHFELLTQDGIAFYNDPDSERAGVIELDGTVRPITKYRTPTTTPTPTTRASGAGRPTRNPTSTPTTRDASASPVLRPEPSPRPGGSGGPPSPTHILDILFSPPDPLTGQSVHIAASTSGQPVKTWRWSVVRTSDSAPETSATTADFTHIFSTAANYTVTLEVGDGTNTDRMTKTIDVSASPSPLHCGDSITKSVTLRENLVCHGDGLKVHLQDITIDLAGHSILGSGSGTGIDIGGSQRVTIRNGSISGFGTGVLANSSGINNLIDLNVIANGFGLRLSTGLISIEGGSLEGVDAARSSLTFDGTLLKGTIEDGGTNGNSTFIRCTITNATIRISDPTQITDSHFTNNSQLVLSDMHAVVSGNTFENSMIVLLQVSGPVGPIDIDQNTFTGGTYGVYLLNGLFAEVTITRNTFTDVGAAGVYIDAQVDSFVVTGDHFFANGRHSNGATDSAGKPINDGIHLQLPPPSTATISGNDTHDSADYGIKAPGFVSGESNKSTNDAHGCYPVSICEYV